MSSKPLANKVALVTGSGRGLGRSHALLLAALGAKVMVNDTGSATTKGDLDVTEPVAQQVAELIRSTGGEAAWTATSAVDGAALVRETVERFGRLDILVANAGVLRSARLERMSDLNFDLMWKVNMLGAYSAVRAAIPIFLSQGYGRVVLTASTSGIFGSFGGSNCEFNVERSKNF